MTSPIESICVLCSAGSLVGVAGLLFLWLAFKVLVDSELTRGAKALLAFVVVLTCAGFIGCAVEDRVCEVASRRHEDRP